MPERSLVIKVTAGKDDPERCNQAFTVAGAAVASGVRVSLWLTGISLVRAARPGRGVLAPVRGAARRPAGRRHRRGNRDGVHPVRGTPGHHRRRPDQRHKDRGSGDVRRRGHGRRRAGPGLLGPEPRQATLARPMIWWKIRSVQRRPWPATAATSPHRRLGRRPDAQPPVPWTAARRSWRRPSTSSSCRGSIGGSDPATQPSSRSARPGLRTSAGPCR